MATPPRDKNGLVKPHDDQNTIPDGAEVVRYIHRQWLTPNPDGTRRLSTGAFSGSSKDRDPYQGMSGDMLDRLNDRGLDPATRMPPEHEGAVLIQAGGLRSLGLKVGPDPTLENDPFHASVWGVKKSHRKTIKAMSKWLIKPPDVQ